MASASWLFVKGSESIWVERPHGYSMIVAGPGSLTERHDFTDEDAVQAYQVAIAEQLTGNGWLLWGFDKDRRSGRERRVGSRTSPDRRRNNRRE